MIVQVYFRRRKCTISLTIVDFKMVNQTFCHFRKGKGNVVQVCIKLSDVCDEEAIKLPDSVRIGLLNLTVDEYIKSFLKLSFVAESQSCLKDCKNITEQYIVQ